MLVYDHKTKQMFSTNIKKEQFSKNFVRDGRVTKNVAYYFIYFIYLYEVDMDIKK